MAQLNLFGDDDDPPPAPAPAGRRKADPQPLPPAGNPWDIHEFLKQCTPGERRAWEKAQRLQATME